LGKLKAFAVFAFCAEMTRLPGHCEPRHQANHAVAIHHGRPHVKAEATVCSARHDSGQRALNG